MRIKNTLFVGKVRFHLDELESTNLYASELIAKSKPSEGTVISTFNQWGGRGQIGSKWLTQPLKNIACSLILHPTFLPIHQQFLLNQAVSLAVTDLVALYSAKALQVKWPNDIYLNGKKLVGILIQGTIAKGNFQSAIVGIGINVNQTEFAPELPNPTSLKLEEARDFNLEELVLNLCHCVEARYLQLRQKKWTQIQETYLEMLYQLGELKQYYYPDGAAFYGKIIGVSPIGKLLIETKHGIEDFAMKEVLFKL